MSRSTKYSEERVKKICEAIATHGGDEAGWKAGRIGKATFYRWKNENQDFQDAIARAREQFCENCDENLKITTYARLQDVITNGQVIKWKKTIQPRKVTRYRGDESEGKVWYTDVFEETVEETVEIRDVPRWAIERVLGPPAVDLEAAIALIERHGLSVIVKDADKIKEWMSAYGQTDSQDRSGGSGRGLSEHDFNEINARILGVPENASGTSAVPSEVDS